MFKLFGAEKNKHLHKTMAMDGNISTKEIDQTGCCYCGSVKYKLQGEITMSALCHCKTCSRFRGMSPIHLLVVEPAKSLQFIEGENITKMYHEPKITGFMEYCFCTKCGGSVYQCPIDANWRTVFPTNFHISDGK